MKCPSETRQERERLPRRVRFMERLKLRLSSLERCNRCLDGGKHSRFNLEHPPTPATKVRIM